MSDMDHKVEEMKSRLGKKLKTWDRPIWGYTPPVIHREIGEEWIDEDGKKWVQRNGYKESISKLQGAKTPWFCPKCSKSLSHRFDMKFYRIYNQCYDCTIIQQTKMRIDGTWEAFERKTLRSNERGFLKDMIAQYKDYIRTFKVPQVHFENGGWQELGKLEQFKELFDQIRNDIKICETRLAELDEEERKEQEIST